MWAEVKLTITHDDFGPGSKVYAAISGGWPMVLASLKSFLETGRALTLSSAEAAKDAQDKAIAAAQGAAGAERDAGLRKARGITA
jgi:hypothetical protein